MTRTTSPSAPNTRQDKRSALALMMAHPELAPIVPVVSEQLDAVKTSIQGIIMPDIEVLAHTIAQTLNNTGKLLRPLVGLLLSAASSTSTSSHEKPVGFRHIETAAVAELIHVATLLHDDVIDDSDLRRGLPTIRADYGNRLSILSGDYLLAQASLKLSQLNNCRLVSIFAMVLANLCEGEVKQLKTGYTLDMDWPTYLRKNVCKTASLFAACGESAGVNNHLPESDIARLQQFGEQFGIAFQIVDDLLDYTADAQTLGKPVLDDLKNGLINAPVLIAFDKLNGQPDRLKQFKNLCLQLFNDQNEAVIPDIQAVIDDTNALAATKDLARHYAKAATDAIAHLRPSPYKTALDLLVDYSIHRQM
ncbi:MAG: polyprenyl synthetase family protein [Cyanobacteria bacterium HKST-UBA06]|nr:polyprenyl synthetase family protein [Cyanobacteria bacterium HKST-UBA04]MCA9806771.1 polyprenyl synthetase family protein [Cyanobacteria bacterium HKST-UBA06]MCA9841594.1 polyprenyl synthetase family protein [Cyanobacteria bacterium HKST-UBA03]